ncbi:MAG: dUTP diphosphatase [Dehalococcoidia bacterium]|jgi:dUTP pyrophosphatase|nr:dUTP diphosphatase [Dehalococcoidia bacterium]
MDQIELRWRRLRPNALLPEQQTALASGYDLHACLDEPLVLGTMPTRVPTGVAIASPAGIDVQVRPRSGLFARGVIGTVGTLDADYRGELFVTLYCLPDLGSFEITDGDRIGQIVVARLVDASWLEVEELDETVRGAGGHGSTGLR